MFRFSKKSPNVYSRRFVSSPEYGSHDLPVNSSLSAEERDAADKKFIDENKQRWAEEHQEANRRHEIARRAVSEVLPESEWDELRGTPGFLIPRSGGFRMEEVESSWRDICFKQAMLRLAANQTAFRFNHDVEQDFFQTCGVPECPTHPGERCAPHSYLWIINELRRLRILEKEKQG